MNYVHDDLSLLKFPMLMANLFSISNHFIYIIITYKQKQNKTISSTKQQLTTGLINP